jgi:hypothetical protein
MMHEITIALYACLTDTAAQVRRVAWDELVEGLGEHHERADKDGPLWSPVVLHRVWRRNENVTALTALVFEVDHADPDWSLLEGLDWAAHTTHSHTPDDPHWRVVIRAKDPVEKARWESVWERARSRLVPNADPQCKDVSRAYFLPSCRPGAERETRRGVGQPLDMAALGPASADDGADSADGSAATSAAPPDRVGDERVAEQLAAVWPADGGRHAFFKTVTGALARRGLPAERATKVLLAAAERAEDAAFLAEPGRRGEIERAAAGAAERLKNDDDAAVPGFPTLRALSPTLADVIDGVYPEPTLGEIVITKKGENARTVEYPAQLAASLADGGNGVDHDGNHAPVRAFKRVGGKMVSIPIPGATAGTPGQPTSSAAAGQAAGGGGNPSQADILVGLAEAASLFSDPLDDAYASVKVGDHRETWPVRSKGFRRWLVKRFHDRQQKVPNNESLGAALGVIEAKAHFGGTRREVHLRVAPDGVGGLYIDLCDAAWHVVHVTAAGWSLEAEAPVAFRRASGMLALPTPTHGGSLDELRELVNVPSDDDWALARAWLLAAARDVGPFPVLATRGEQGSAKSTLCRMLRRLIDPAEPLLRSDPRGTRDLAVAARGSWVVAFDNVSHIHPWLSDALSSLATGSGFATRQLFTDFDEAIFSARRPILLNGITEFITRGDLLDRSIQLTLPVIPEHERRPEKELWARFGALHPRLLGGLLDDLVGALRELPTVELKRLPRMADFTLWAVAAERGRGDGERFLGAYGAARAVGHEQAVEGSPIGPHLVTAVEGGGFEGTAGELLARLTASATEAEVRSKEWPQSTQKLTAELQRLAPAMRARGWRVSRGEGRRRRVITIRPGPEEGAAPAAPPAPSAPPGGDARDAAVTRSDPGDEGSSPADEVRDEATSVGDEGADGAAASSGRGACVRCTSPRRHRDIYCERHAVYDPDAAD